MFVIGVTPSNDADPVRYYCGRRYGVQVFVADPSDPRVARYTGPSPDVEILCAAGYAAELVEVR